MYLQPTKNTQGGHKLMDFKSGCLIMRGLVTLPLRMKQHAQNAQKVAELIQLEIQKLKLPHAQSRVSQSVTLSLGISTQVPEATDSLDGLIKAADRALYQAKELGRNCVVMNSDVKSLVKDYKRLSDS